jgi:hypothetical protein
MGVGLFISDPVHKTMHELLKKEASSYSHIAVSGILIYWSRQDQENLSIPLEDTEIMMSSMANIQELRGGPNRWCVTVDLGRLNECGQLSTSDTMHPTGDFDSII